MEYDEAYFLEGQEFPQDKCLTDEEYATGKWYRFSLERLLSMMQSTRLTTSMIEFIARAGWICYVPMWVWQLKMADVNPLSKRADAFTILWDDEGNRFPLKEGLPIVTQGPDRIPAYLLEEIENPRGRKLKLVSKVNKLFDRGKHNEVERELVADGDVFRVQLQGRDRRGGQKTVTYHYINKKHLQRVRIWVPTPILGDSFVQSPRQPFEMIPKWKLDEELHNEIAAKIANPNELVAYQYTGCPGLDAELIRLYRYKRKPRSSKIPPHIQTLLNSGITLWDAGPDNMGKVKIARRIENLAGMTIRAHRRAADRYINAEQVYEGLKETKRRTNFNPLPPDFLTFAPNLAGATPEQAGEFIRRFDDLIAAVAVGGPFDDDAYEDIDDKIKRLLVALADIDELNAAELRKIFREHYEAWVDLSYDRKYPCEQIHYHEWYYDLQPIYTDTWSSQANRWWYQMRLRIHMVQEPAVVSSPQQRFDFRAAKLFVADFESWRNVEHMQEHWKYSKAFQNTVAAFNEDKNAPQKMRQSDWGGIWNPVRAELDWRWSVLNGEAPMPQTIGEVLHDIASLPSVFAIFGLGPLSAGATNVQKRRRHQQAEVIVNRQTQRRMELLGPSWFDKEPWQKIDHDGDLIERFGGKKVSWVGSSNGLKFLHSSTGRFQFPTDDPIDSKLDKESVKHRDYDSEHALLVNDEYYARDPVDLFENQQGIAIFSVINDVNVRLKSSYRDFPAIRLTYDNCFAFQAMIDRMWVCTPVRPIIRSVEKAISAWKEENKPHLRPLIDKKLEGVYRSKELIPHLERWYEDSDDHVTSIMYWKTAMGSTLEGGPSGANAWAIRECAKVTDEGYGLGYGTLKSQQMRQEFMIECGLWNDWLSVVKGVIEWWSVRVSAVEIWNEKSWPGINDLKLKLAGLLESRKLIYIVAERVLWPMLKLQHLLHVDEPFPLRKEEAESVDWSYITKVLNVRAGTKYIPTPEQAEADEAYLEAREEVINRNMEKYLAICRGEHFKLLHSRGHLERAA